MRVSCLDSRQALGSSIWPTASYVGLAAHRRRQACPLRGRCSHRLHSQTTRYSLYQTVVQHYQPARWIDKQSPATRQKWIPHMLGRVAESSAQDCPRTLAQGWRSLQPIASSPYSWNWREPCSHCGTRWGIQGRAWLLRALVVSYLPPCR